MIIIFEVGLFFPQRTRRFDTQWGSYTDWNAELIDLLSFLKCNQCFAANIFFVTLFDNMAVTHLSVVNTVSLHHVEQRLLPSSVLLLEHVMLRVSPGDISVDCLRDISD